HRRIYRSGTVYDGPLGHGWDHSHNQRIVESDDDCGNSRCFVVLMTGDGSTLRFTPGAETVTQDIDGLPLVHQRFERDYVAPPGVNLSIHLSLEQTVNPFAGTVTILEKRWRLERPDGTVGLFDGHGVLTRLEDATGYGLDLIWKQGPTPDG